MVRRLRVQHWVAYLEAAVEPPVGVNNYYNLFRVGYVHAASADVEFPWSLPQLDMFVRFVNGTGVAEFEIRVDWLDAPDHRREMQSYGPFRVAFRPTEPTRDTIFRCVGVPINGPGRYRFSLWRIKPRRRRPLAAEYITVVRLP
jgi:hypothetical protein